MNKQQIFESVTHVAKGAAMGALCGMVVGAVSARSKVMQQNKTQKFDISKVKVDQAFVEVLGYLEPYAKLYKPTSLKLVETVFRCSNDIVEGWLQLNAKNVLAPGVITFRMNRQLVEMKKALESIERICARTRSSDDLTIQLCANYETVKTNIFTCADNYIHNSMLV